MQSQQFIDNNKTIDYSNSKSLDLDCMKEIKSNIINVNSKKCLELKNNRFKKEENRISYIRKLENSNDIIPSSKASIRSSVKIKLKESFEANFKKFQLNLMNIEPSTKTKNIIKKCNELKNSKKVIKKNKKSELI